MAGLVELVWGWITWSHDGHMIKAAAVTMRMIDPLGSWPATNLHAKLALHARGADMGVVGP